MKKFLIPVLLLALLLCFTACSNNQLNPVLSNTPAPDAGESASSDALAPSDAADPTPTPLPVAEPDPMEIEVSDAGFDELYEKSSYVLLGTVDDNGEEWNSCRDKDDVTKPNSTVFMMDMSFKFTVTESLKGDLKAGDVIQYNLAYRDKYPGEDDYTMNEMYLAPVKGGTYLIFVEQDPVEELKNYYYVSIEPHCFELKDDKLYIYTLHEDKDSWGEGQGVAGVEYASAKLEMGIK